jgi:PPOX class probable F420-dependent enzyme
MDQSVPQVPDGHRDLLERPLIAHLATVRADGEPQSSPVWFGWDGERIRLTHTRTRQKFRNLQAEPRVALSIVDPDNSQRYLEVRGAVEEVADDELFEQYDTNVFGVWRMCRAVLPAMRERGRGVIVNVSSFGGQAPFPGIGAYRSSKFALEGLTWTLRLEVAHFGIRVIAVQPGLVETDFATRSLKRACRPASAYDPMREAAARAYPRMSPKALPPEAVADAIVAAVALDRGPLHVRVGEDTERVLAAVRAGEEAYERYLVEELGFDWHLI